MAAKTVRMDAGKRTATNMPLKLLENYNYYFFNLTYTYQLSYLYLFFAHHKWLNNQLMVVISPCSLSGCQDSCWVFHQITVLWSGKLDKREERTKGR